MASKTDLRRRFRLALKPLLIIAVLAQSPTLVVYSQIRCLPLACFLLVAALFQAALVFVIGLSICQVALARDGLTLNRIKYCPGTRSSELRAQP